MEMIPGLVIFSIGLALGAVCMFFVMKKRSEEKAASFEQAYKDIYEKMQLQFENLSNKIFKETTQDFSNTSKERIAEILEPFKEKFEEIPLKAFYPFSFIIVSLLFGFVHQEWIAGVLCGIIYQGLVCWKGRLGDAIVAHGLTNLLLGVWVPWQRAWNFW